MAEEEPPVGYPTKIFIQTPSDAMTCTICQGVLRQAQRVCDNDHMYCAACVGEWARSSDKCPSCRSVMSAKPARVLNNLITELTVCCSAYGEDERTQAAAAASMPAYKKCKTSKNASASTSPALCDWTGALADAEAHQKVCLFEFEECPFEHCSHRAIRRDLEAHKVGCCRRTKACVHCAKVELVLGMEMHLQYDCPAMICKCWNHDCDVSLPRKDLEVHQITVCPYASICCPYCEHREMRKDMAQHTDNASIHLPLIFSKLEKLPILEAEVASLRRAAAEESRTTTMLRSHLKASLGQARSVRVDRGRGGRWSTNKGAYSGQMRADRRHGYGHFLCDNGETYEGEWEDDCREGQGTHTLNRSAQ
mmetsp:Transcript_17559/g.38947  ORF Transcript_17559/g.38947 Transcript_17559/m.38947 type:complete len:365 (+) Transcript_17559:36-1130(+)